MHHLKKTAKASSQEVLKNNSVLRRLLAATLSVSGAWQLLPLVALAQSAPLTPAGTGISNTATGTYVDPNNPTLTINATSNTVTVTVAEVAGITVVGNGISDSSPATPVLPNNVLTYSFLITNVGNDTTTVKIPAPVITGPATLIATNPITYDVDLNGNGTVEAGDFTGTTLANAEAAILQVGGKIKVNVSVDVALSATSGAPIKVQLGDTPPNDNSAATQNQLSTNLGTDLRTVDTATGEINGLLLAAAEREASAVQTILVGATPQAFAAVLKTRSATTPPVPVSSFDTVLVPYNLSLKVDSAAPAGASASLTPTDLVGTSITLDSTTVTKVLVSDVIPASTTLVSVAPPDLTWTVVYSTVDPAVTTTNTALNTNWTVTAPALATVKRIGFIKDGPIAKGTTVSGFTFTVRTTGLSPTTGGNVYNIAQLFGGSVGGTTVVYDESGDQTPSNFNDDGSVGPLPTNGVAAPATDGIDNAGNNTGTGTGGEDNSLVLAAPGTLLNGPLNSPAAVGPTDNNDDFTNKSTNVPVGSAPDVTPTATVFNPDSVTFTNTLNAPSTALTNVLLRPVAPTGIPGAAKSGSAGLAGDLPTGTTATLTYGADTAIYTYNGTQFVYTNGTAIEIPNIPANSSVNYTVVVDLPAGTGLSTDDLVNRGYPVPILAFSDNGGGTPANAGNAVLNTGESSNITIDRVYTGYLRLFKQSRVLESLASPVAVAGADGTFSTAAKTPSPGNIIEYLIRYSNISTPSVGSGNVILNASNVVITEDGTGTVGGTTNNWAKSIVPGGVIFTSHVTGSAIDSGTSSTITFFAGATGIIPVTEQTGTTATTDITKYVNTLAVPVAPQETRTFGFQRKLN